jgi:histone deacetylase 11
MVDKGIHESIAEGRPDIIFYNAGSDILVGDPLNGGVQISAAGVSKRDEIVFQAALESKVPVAMVLSGGYARNNAAVVSASLLNLIRRFGLVGHAQRVYAERAAERTAAPAQDEEESKGCKDKKNKKNKF